MNDIERQSFWNQETNYTTQLTGGRTVLNSAKVFADPLVSEEIKRKLRIQFKSAKVR